MIVKLKKSTTPERMKERAKVPAVFLLVNSFLKEGFDWPIEGPLVDDRRNFLR